MTVNNSGRGSNEPPYKKQLIDDNRKYMAIPSSSFSPLRKPASLAHQSATTRPTAPTITQPSEEQNTYVLSERPPQTPQIMQPWNTLSRGQFILSRAQKLSEQLAKDTQK